MALRDRNEAAKSFAQVDNRSCMAHGCPMPGSITDTTKPSEQTQWMCRFHFNEEFKEWNDITRKVRMLTDEQRRTLAYLPIRPLRSVA